MGHLTLLPVGSPISAPSMDNLSPKEWDGRALPCPVQPQLTEEQGEGRGSRAVPASWGGSGQPEGISPPKCAGREPGHCAPSPAQPAAWLRQLPRLASDICCCSSHGNVREAGGWQSRPGKPKAALTPSGRGDEAQAQPRLVFSLRGSEPTWEVPSGAGSCDPACS